MFSSNQILKISGDLGTKDSINNALSFALIASGNMEYFTRLNNSAKCVFQITADGRFCIGSAYEEEEGWTEFPFDFDVDIISKIIIQHLDKQEIKYTDGDGSHYKGFLMQQVPMSFAKEKDGIINPLRAILSFEPYTCFYHK